MSRFSLNKKDEFHSEWATKVVGTDAVNIDINCEPDTILDGNIHIVDFSIGDREAKPYADPLFPLKARHSCLLSYTGNTYMTEKDCDSLMQNQLNNLLGRTPDHPISTEENIRVYFTSYLSGKRPL